MQNDNDREPRDREPQNGGEGGGGEGGFNWKGIVLLSIAFGLIALAVMARGSGGSAGDVPYQKFKQLVAEGKIHVDENAKPPKVLRVIQRDNSDKEWVSGWYERENPKENESKYAEFRTPIILDFTKEDLLKTIEDANKKSDVYPEGQKLRIYEYVNEEPPGWATLLTFYLPLLLLVFLLYLLFRHQIRMAGRGAMSFGKSKAKMMALDKNKITFKDVAGVEEAKEEVWEIVEFLKDPKKFQRLGGRIPKGVLMVGSPGTGKTLLARAIAGEADVPFFSISGSDFVEMFVGVGASRVRDMFEQGKKNAPCLIFIDEIDAVGRHRGHGLGGGHDEREQTLNALLVEMDGFDTQEGVIIIAATNRPDVLDPALLRPGRFDRQITVPLPDVKGREEILRVHAKKVKVADDVDMAVIARGTPGYSGAELANVINEAALLAARKGMKAITLKELEEARDKVRWGKERRSLAISEKEKENTAYHEAGHAILLCLLENTEPLHKVTIIPRGPSLGSTMWLPEEDKFTNRKNELLDQLVVTMGGRVAEDVVFGDVTNGASGDIRQATHMARKMVCEWGMSEELGMIEYGDHQEHLFLAKELSSPRNYSEATAQKIDAEVKRLIDNAYDKAKELIVKNREKLNAIAEGLLEYETLDASHIKEIMEHGEMRNPPTSPTPPDLPQESQPAPEPGPEKSNPDEGELPGNLAPAGA